MDKNAGKYEKLYKKEFEYAQTVLADEGGVLEWGTHDYQAFTFKRDDVCLIFYPHRTSAFNYHIRTRSQGSKNKDEANRLMQNLDDCMEQWCTFTYKKAN